MQFPNVGSFGRAAICAGYGIVIYLFISEAFVFAHDPANFSLAVRHGWSLTEDRPHAPGYPWFVECFRLIATVLPVTEHGAMLIFNAAMAAIALWLFWRFSERQFGDDHLVPVLLFATNPVVLYFAASSEIYIYDAAFSIAAFTVVLWAERKWLIPSMFVLGMLGGFRFSSLVLLLPAFVFLWHWRRPSGIASIVRQLLLGGLAFAAGVMTWLLPYFYLPYGDLSLVFEARERIGSLTVTIYQQMIGFATILAWTFNFSVVAFLFRKERPESKSIRLPLFVWLVFPVVFFSVIHYAKGYVLLVLPILVVLIAQQMMCLRRGRQLAVGLAGLNLLLFFLVPFVTTPVEASLPNEQRQIDERLKTTLLRAVSVSAPTYAHIQTTDEAMADALTLVRTHCPPGSAIIIDYSAPYCYYPRALQVYFPDRDFLVARRDTLVNVYAGPDMEADIPLGQALRTSAAYYVMDRRLPAIVGAPPESTLLGDARYLSLYRITIGDTTALLKYMTRQK